MNIIKFALLAVVTVTLATPMAQGQFIKSKKNETTINWQNLSFREEGVYGIGIQQAYNLLEGKKPKKEVVVAIIGPGIDAEHEDLAESIWQNKKETGNGVDDDKNGYIDDLNGWNYLGNRKGDVLEEALSFGDREFFRLKDKYGEIQSNGIDFFTPNREETKMVKVEVPEDINEYQYYVTDVRRNSSLASKHGGLEISKMVRTYLKQFDKDLRAKFPDQTDFSINDFASLAENDIDSLRMVSMVFTNIAFSVVPNNPTWNNIVEYLNTIQKVRALERWNKALEGIDPDDRRLIGDDPYNPEDTNYGNNTLLTENAGTGTMHAGIVAAQRNNNKGIDGIAENSRIMVLRTNPNKGDAFLKDMARAIRYAVDNGADIIQLTSSAFHALPYGEQSKWIEDALVYAESGDILIVQPVEDLSYDMDTEFFFPNRKLSSGKILGNIITVAASDREGNPLLTTNFGIKSLDIYAPGKEIYSTYTGDTYRSASGSDMAASVVSGVAALIKSYYPALGGKQIREILMNSVTDRTGAEVEKQAYFSYGDEKRLGRDLFLFEELSASGGILNAEQAIKSAGEKQ